MQYSHLPCPYCDSSDAYSYNTELNVYHCFSCHAKGILDKSKLPPLEEMSGMTLEPYLPDEYRGIKKETLEKCGVYFTRHGDSETVHYTYADAVKHRELPKNIKCSGKLNSFWGQEDYNGGGKYITIVEGEEDRMSVIQMMGNYPVVSVPGATPSKEFWQNAQGYLQGFEKIILSVDNDDAGNKLAEKFYRIFPGKVYRVNHTKYKDANDFLKAKATGEYKSAWWNAQRVKPESILSTAEDFEKLYHETPDYEYFPTNIDGLDSKMLGIHKGAFTVILAPSGIGKTEFMRYLEWQCFEHGKYSFAMCHLEETQLRSVLGLVSYDLKENLTRKDLIEKSGREEDVLQSMRNLTRDERVYQFSVRTDDTVEDMLDNIRFLVNAMGVDYVFLEPIQDVVTGDVSNKESILTDLTNKLKRLAPELNVGIVVIAHANEDGDPKYCRSIIQGAAYAMRLDRKADSEDPLEANTTHVYIDRKNRTGNGVGYAGALTFEQHTYMLTPEVGPSEPVFDHTPSGEVPF